VEHSDVSGAETTGSPEGAGPWSGAGTNLETTRRNALWLGAAAAGVAVGASLVSTASASASTPARTPVGGVASTNHRGGPTISRQPFGSVNGTPVYRYTLDNGCGVTARILNYGGIIQELVAPDRHGRRANVVLGFATVDDYVAHNSPQAGGGVYFGALVGRYANRIAKGTFTVDGTTYHVPVNNNGNSLHGGLVGFNQYVWDATEQSGNGVVGLQLRIVSPDGDQGYPGNLSVTVTYTLDQANRLWARYTATTDKPTVVNLTNHSYFNLAGEDALDVYDQRLSLNADNYTPTDATQIPTGVIAPVHGTPLDFTKPTPIGEHITANDTQLLTGQGYDLNWVLNKPSGGDAPTLAARADDPSSGRTLSVFTTQPGVQFYSSNFLTGTLVGASGHAYRQGAGFALETQHFPDSPNHPHFPTTTLNPGQTYDQTTVWQLGVDG
jgi:aldose 1-epimerase